MSDESNIFRDYKDALFGFAVLVVLPLLSLFSVWKTRGFVYNADGIGLAFWSYSFPLISISISGLFDAITRIEPNAKRNPKLVVRIVFNSIAALLSGVMCGSTTAVLRLVPAALLSVNGLLLLREIGANVTLSIRLSEWGANKYAD